MTPLIQIPRNTKWRASRRAFREAFHALLTGRWRLARIMTEVAVFWLLQAIRSNPDDT
jgi:hypothetical protein